MDGKTFEEFLGNDHFEKKFMSSFDDFLHESFGKWMVWKCDAAADTYFQTRQNVLLEPWQ